MSRPTASILIIAILLFASAHTTVAQNILYDNGPFNDRSAYSIWSPPNPRRSLLEDFELPPGGGTVEAWSTWMIWSSLQGTGHSTKVELTFYGDINGRPDFNDRIAFITTTDITEVLQGGRALQRDIIVITARFPSVFIPEGRTWVDMIWFEPTGDQGFMLSTDVRFTECWVDYADFGGRNPGSAIFGEEMGMLFTLYGTVGGGGFKGTFDCPIGGGVATLNLSGGTADGPVGVAASFSDRGFTIPIGPCAGTIIATAPPYFGGTPIISKFDANGDLSLSANLPPGLCADIFVSAIDLTTCDVVDLPP